MIVLPALLVMAASTVGAQQDCSGGVFWVSAGVVGGSAIYDIATASKSARHYNQKHVSFAPLANPRRGSYGLMASWSFGGGGVRLLSSTDGESAAGGIAVLGGLVVGPSVGHFYAGQGGRGIGTLPLRGAGTAIGIASIVPCFD